MRELQLQCSACYVADCLEESVVTDWVNGPGVIIILDDNVRSNFPSKQHEILALGVEHR